MNDITDLVVKLRESKNNMFMWRTVKNTPCSCIMYWKTTPSNLWTIYNSNKNYFQTKYKSLPLIGDQGFISDNTSHVYLNDFVDPDFFAIADNKSLNVKNNSAIIIFLGKGSKPNKSKFAEFEIIKKNWV